jgi:hypothetical protein
MNETEMKNLGMKMSISIYDVNQSSMKECRILTVAVLMISPKAWCLPITTAVVLKNRTHQ